MMVIAFTIIKVVLICEDHLAEQNSYHKKYFCLLQSAFSAIIQKLVEKPHWFLVDGTRVMLTSTLAYKKKRHPTTPKKQMSHHLNSGFLPVKSHKSLLNFTQTNGKTYHRWRYHILNRASRVTRASFK